MPPIDYSILRGQTVLVTGGAGFVGKHLSERLLDLGAFVVCIDNFSTSKEEGIAHLIKNPNYAFFRGDVNRFEDISNVFSRKKIDYVFHAAAMVGVKHVVERPLEVFRDIEGIKYILALSQAHRIRKIVFASSSEAYGEPTELPEREEGHLNVNPNDPYGLTKLVGENMVKNYYRLYGLAGTSLRFFNVYGPGQRTSVFGFVVGIFMEKALSGEPFLIFGDGLQTRDFVYVDDNIEIELRALLSQNTNGETINVGCGRQTTILELAERIARLAGVEPRFDFQPKRSHEIRYRCPDTAKMTQLLGYAPTISLDEGLKRTFEWYKAQRKV